MKKTVKKTRKAKPMKTKKEAAKPAKTVVVADKDQPIEAGKKTGTKSKTVEKVEEPSPAELASMAAAIAAKDDGGPNADYPFAIKFTTATGASYERYKTAKVRDKRLAVVGKSEAVEVVNFTAPAPPQPGPDQKPTLVAGKAPKKKEPGSDVTQINKRITPGAHVDEWRVARSLRVGKPGFFLQGGYIEVVNGKKFFRVAEEEYFKSLTDAKTAMVAKLPVAVPVGKAN